MKKISMLALALVLTLFMLTGCGCRNSKPANTAPTVLPTMRPTTEAATEPTSTPTAAPNTQATQSATDATLEDGNGFFCWNDGLVFQRNKPGGHNDE